MTELHWEDPPPSHSYGKRLLAFTEEAAAVKRAAGRWLRLVVKENRGTAQGMASRIKNRKEYPALWGCEAVCRQTPEGFAVYVRWPEGGEQP